MNTIKLGDYNTLTIVKQVDFGMYLDGGDDGEILLPQRYVPQNAKVGEEIDVFIYLDIDERLVATTQKPLAKVGDFAHLSVAWVNNSGAFLAWGLLKDLFCPFAEQKKKMKQDEKHIVYVLIDKQTHRIMASAKVEHYLNKTPTTFEHEEEADLLIWQETDLGYKVIINNQYQGLIYKNQVFKPIAIGDKMKGYITQVRPDGKIDVALQRSGRQMTEDFSDTLITYLKEHNGVCYLGDKSSPEEIKQVFNVSKKVFKKTVGDLYRRRLIAIENKKISLL